MSKSIHSSVLSLEYINFAHQNLVYYPDKSQGTRGYFPIGKPCCIKKTCKISSSAAAYFNNCTGSHSAISIQLPSLIVHSTEFKRFSAKKSVSLLRLFGQLYLFFSFISVIRSCLVINFRESKKMEVVSDVGICSHCLCRLSGYGGINVGLPPASPSEGDLMVTVRFLSYT